MTHIKASNPTQISDFNSLNNQFDTYFLDMYGVLWDGTQFYPNVLSTLTALKEANKKVYILSNMTALNETFVAGKEKNGLLKGIHYDDVITSGDICFAEIENGLFEKITGKTDYRYFVLGGANPALFKNVNTHETTDIHQADVIYFSTVQTEAIEDNINHLMPNLKIALARQLPAVCANPDLVFMKNGRSLPTQGAVGLWYEQHGGQVTYFGKPHKSTFDYALKVTNSKAERTLMVGDMMETDIQGGHNAGIKTMLVTQTGITGHLLHSGKTLSDIFNKINLQPHYIKSRFSDDSFAVKLKLKQMEGNTNV